MMWLRVYTKITFVDFSEEEVDRVGVNDKGPLVVWAKKESDYPGKILGQFSNWEGYMWVTEETHKAK